MRKRVLSLFLAFVLSFSMMPMSVFAEEAGTVTEQEAQSGEDTVEVSASGGDTVEVFTSGEDTVEVSATGEDTVEVSTTGEDISGGNAVTKDAAVEAAQALIDALPEEVTAANTEELQAQLMAIDEALAALNEEQTDKLNMTRYDAVCEALNGLVAVQDVHKHNLCGGDTCTKIGHNCGTETEFEAWTQTTELPNTAGNYYLTDDVMLSTGW